MRFGCTVGPDHACPPLRSPASQQPEPVRSVWPELVL
jgi:hypothetical protein